MAYGYQLCCKSDLLSTSNNTRALHKVGPKRRFD